MLEKIVKIVKFSFGLPLSLLALFFVFKIIYSNTNLIYQIKTVNFFLLFISITLFLVYFFQRSYLWKKILELKTTERLPFFENAYLWEIAEIRRFIPGNVISIITRISSFSQKEINKKTTLFLFSLEAFFILTADLTISFFSLKLIAPFYYKYFLLVEIFISFLFLLFIFALFKIKNNFSKVKDFIKKVKYQKILNLFLNAFISEILFGLGSYLAISSIFNLPVSSVLKITGFIVFAKLIGYLSIITPMGLGIREGVIMAGLLKYLSSFASAISAIFARLILIISEFLFLILIIILKRFKKNAIKFEDFFSKNKYFIFTLIAVVIYIAYFSVASCLRYTNFYTGRFDLGNMDQTVWNTLHNKFFTLTNPDGTNIVSRLSYHADFILILLVPFYLIWQDPRMLLLIQSFIIGIGGIFIYLIVLKQFNNKALAFAFSLSYLLYPALGYSNLYDFHAVSLIPTFFLGAYFFIKNKQYFLSILLLILAGICKEEVWAITALFGIYIFFWEKKKIIGFLIFSVSSFLLFFLFLYAIPHFHDGPHFAFSYYSDFGTNPAQIIQTIIFNPVKTFKIISEPVKFIYFNQLLMPVFYLPFFSIFYMLFALPDLIMNILSTNSQLHQIYYQYTGGVTAFIFISSINSVYFLKEKFKFIPINFLIFLIIASSFLSAYVLGPLPFSLKPNIDMFDKPLKNADIISDFLDNVGSSYSIASTNNLGSHLSHRSKIFTIPVGIDQADIVTFLLNDKFAQPSLKAQIKIAEKMKHDKNYIEVIKLNDFLVFEKRNLYLKKKIEIKSPKIFPLSISALERRDYLKSKITKNKKIIDGTKYKVITAYFYPDGIKTQILIFKPKGNKNYPVIIMPFYPLDKTTSSEEKNLYLKSAIFFSERNFISIIIEPANNKNNSLSESLEMPIKTLDLLSSLENFKNVNSNQIFLWGEGAGGQTVLSSLEANNINQNENLKFLSASIWSPIINVQQTYNSLILENLNENAYSTFFKQIKGFKNKNIIWNSISPIYYLTDIKSPLNITSFSESEINYLWGVELYNDLQSLGKNANFYLSNGNEFNNYNLLFLEKDLLFFKSQIANYNKNN